MNLEKIKVIFQRKPVMFLGISFGYLLLLSFAKWGIHPTWGTVLFLIGGLIGVYFLDIAEVFFALSPSPFRSILFTGAFILVALFIVTSSGSTLATGLVLSMYLSLVLWQIGEWSVVGNLNSWYRMIAVPVEFRFQKMVLVAFVVLFIFETVLFLR